LLIGNSQATGFFVLAPSTARIDHISAPLVTNTIGNWYASNDISTRSISSPQGQPEWHTAQYGFDRGFTGNAVDASNLKSLALNDFNQQPGLVATISGPFGGVDLMSPITNYNTSFENFNDFNEDGLRPQFFPTTPLHESNWDSSFPFSAVNNNNLSIADFSAATAPVEQNFISNEYLIPATVSVTATANVALPTQQDSIPCSILSCPRTFKRNYERARHEGTVHGINRRAYLCPIHGCLKGQGRGYSRADKLTEHLYKKHGNLGYRKRA
jgi:hypothetical protein